MPRKAKAGTTPAERDATIAAGAAKPPKPVKRAKPAAKAAAKAAPKRAPRKKAAPSPKPVYRTGYVALIGRPNTGKSTLLNALIGQKVAIVSDKPQTTRISILGIKTTDKGQIVFVDNPGIHKPLHTLNKRMMNFVYSALETSDVVCLLVDAAQKFGHGDEYVLETLRRVKTPVFLLINKVDIVRKDTVLPIIEHYKDIFPFKEIIPISALKGVNLDILEKLLLDLLPEAPKLYSDDEISDQTERFLYAEIIREKILRYVTQELPFVTAVYIESIENKEQADWKKPGESRPMTYIRASIFVEKDNHRKIIIGRHGSLIKQIGIEARQEIAEYIEHKIYLDLQVRVRENWRDSEDVLDLIEGQKG
jgi:GTP-binding protein Era